MPDKIYCYPDSDVLKNRMGIRDMEQLKRMEGRFPSAWHTFFRKSMPCTPFREGNGRCQREFIRTLALQARYVINFANVTGEEMLKASEDSFLCDYKKMEQLFACCIRKRN